eukprot:gnl/TRDRNA2_/TRDRNA2_166326_c0_seq2.p1 gnl/TRDRNA2_/TRDRNA2_166326_c0~~gnl/TRDRNA2_/TRDRNA2_166326_c0_seq2.p1  ORF type:complete len:221 (+),score=44.52 gnl/TRDRNA2_/TRDRNA2_166326_c0_seq2:66-728(+)
MWQQLLVAFCVSGQLPLELAAEAHSDEAEAELDLTDADLTHTQRRTRMYVCMELVRRRTNDNSEGVKSTVQQLSDRLSEEDARNVIYHSLLVNCYHGVQQEEVESYGAEELSADRLLDIFTRPPDRPQLKLSRKQLEVLNQLLREEEASTKPAVEVGGARLSSLDSDMQLVIGILAALLCAGCVACLVAALTCPSSGRSVSLAAGGGGKAKGTNQLRRRK